MYTAQASPEGKGFTQLKFLKGRVYTARIQMEHAIQLKSEKKKSCTLQKLPVKEKGLHSSSVRSKKMYTALVSEVEGVYTSNFSRKQNVHTAQDTEGKSVHSSWFRRKKVYTGETFPEGKHCTVQVAEGMKCTQLKFQKNQGVYSSSSSEGKNGYSPSFRSKKVCRYRPQPEFLKFKVQKMMETKLSANPCRAFGRQDEFYDPCPLRSKVQNKSHLKECLPFCLIK